MSKMPRYGLGAPFYPQMLIVTQKKSLDQSDSELQKSPGIQIRKVVYSDKLNNEEQIVYVELSAIKYELFAGRTK